MNWTLNPRATQIGGDVATIGIRRKHDKDEIFGIKVVKTSKKLRQEPLLKD